MPKHPKSEGMRTDTPALASAMEILARQIQCEDGVATAAIAEGALRLRELECENAKLRQEREELRGELDNINRRVAHVCAALG